MGSKPKEINWDLVEQTLCQVPEIEAARVVADENNSIEEVHILALPTKGPKQIVRDIESTLMACFGLAVDHKKISIAQISNGGREQARLRIESINTEITGVHAKVSVHLLLNGDDYEGVASGLASQTGRLRLVALATLNAVEKFSQGNYSFALEDVAIVQLGQEKVAVACVSMLSTEGEESFAGSALVRQSENDSLARAALNAINRRFGTLIVQ